MLSPSPDFFQTKRGLSDIKAELLPAYFKVWAETAASEELVLADLNAGNGLEANGEKAVALKIQEAENATENEEKNLNLFLSDASKANLEKLKQSLQHATEEGEDEPRLPENTFLLNEPEAREMLAETLKKVPGLVAADPFSYALGEEIIANVIQNSSADLFLLFDFKKLEKAFLAENPTGFLTHLFGEALPESKPKYQLQKSPKLREQFLLEHLESAFRKIGFYPLSFKINPPGKSGNTVYLLLISRSPENYFRAKEWLQTFSEKQEDGVPLFGVNLNYQPAAIPGFSDFLNKYSLESLTQELAKRKSDFHYKTIREVYESHSCGTNYGIANYLSAFRQLYKAEKVNLVDASNKKVTKVTPEAVVFYRLHSK
ncbi:three-Cys-motif partner protein TcmP [Adhaeribacter soli]|uniref:Three-Cys-motif partner protein TcmP n=1 Tax=Adhaeribacter soli TaxID=2607655 RepID=A0A5N1J0T9_9BACT|nr:three-Cys-motif partner protein TcmP [Adhaeribacter soli]KAA9340250.1 three-Cys-motif partner protein TcmP [Adhaeribacter soli]